MSVFGGDSWGREAQYRKRSFDDILLDAVADHSSYRKLPSGKYACLVCPHNPLLDTPLMLSMHMKARRHCDAEKRIKQREKETQNEMNKRIALSPDSTSVSKSDTSTKPTNLASKPLIEKTRKTALEVLHSYPEHNAANNSRPKLPVSATAQYGLTSSTSVQMEASGEDIVQLPLDYRERRQRELKFTAAGWKRDCHGGWFRDENVEFDSDEEDPNVSLAIG